MYTIRIALLGILLASPFAANAQSATSANYWTLGKLQRLNQSYTVHTNIPVECRPRVMAAATTWTNASTGFVFTYRYLVSAQSWSWDSFDYNENPYADSQYGDNVSTSANTNDTSIESGRVDRGDSIAQVERRGVRNAAGTRWLFSDGDVVFNYGIFGTTAWCSTSNATSGKNDVESVALHELGHVFGLEHDGDDSNAIMGPGYIQGTTRRSLTTRDISRTSWLAQQQW